MNRAFPFDDVAAHGTVDAHIARFREPTRSRRTVDTPDRRLTGRQSGVLRDESRLRRADPAKLWMARNVEFEARDGRRAAIADCRLLRLCSCCK